MRLCAGKSVSIAGLVAAAVLGAASVASAQGSMSTATAPEESAFTTDRQRTASEITDRKSAGVSRDDRERYEFSLTWRPTYRAFYVTYENDEQTWEERAFIEKTPESVRLLEAELARFELFGKVPMGEQVGLYMRAIGGPRFIQLFNQQPVQSGVDLHLDTGITFAANVMGLARVRTFFGAELYRWWFDASEVPGNSHLGLVLALQPTWGNFSLLFEGRLSALPLLYRTPLGGLSDASTLRTRAQYEIPLGAFTLVTGMEVFHTKTDFFGSRAVPGHSALAMDDIQLAVTTGAKATF